MKHLKTGANLVFLSITIMAIVYFVNQFNLFSSIRLNIEQINNSEGRIADIITIDLKIEGITCINSGLLED